MPEPASSVLLADAWDMWETISQADKRDIILEKYPVAQWYDDAIFPVLASYRHHPVHWARIKARCKVLGGNPWDLEKAADFLIGPPTIPLLPIHKNGATTVSSTDFSPESLATRFPEHTSHLLRDIGTSDEVHAQADDALMELGIHEGWSDGEILALILNIHEEARHPYADPSMLSALLGSAYVRTQGMDVIQGEDEASIQQRLAQMGKAKLIAYLARTWKLPLARVLRHGNENSLWSLVLQDERVIHLGSTKDVCNQGKTRVAIFDVTGINIPRISQKQIEEWDAILKALFDAAETVDAPEMTREGQIRAMILGYLEDQQCLLDRSISSEEHETIAWERRPFVWKERLYIHAQHMFEYYVTRFYRDITMPQLIDMFTLLDAQRRTVAIHMAQHTSRSFWTFNPSTLQTSESCTGEEEEI